jgi:hypothetical protein
VPSALTTIAANVSHDDTPVAGSSPATGPDSPPDALLATIVVVVVDGIGGADCWTTLVGVTVLTTVVLATVVVGASVLGGAVVAVVDGSVVDGSVVGESTDSTIAVPCPTRVAWRTTPGHAGADCATTAGAGHAGAD